MYSVTAHSPIIYGYILSLFCDSLSAIIVSSTRLNTYNPFVIVFYCNCTKLVVALVVYFWQQMYTSHRHSVGTVALELCRVCADNYWTYVLYAVPAVLYLLSDVLWYFNLSRINPFEYSMLWQFRIVMTAIIYQMLFNRILSRIQWLSLLLLTIGCCVKQVVHYWTPSATTGPQSAGIYATLPPVLAQMVSSCFAGVYNEYLLKGRPLDPWLQNGCLYLNAITVNAFIILTMSSSQEFHRFLVNGVYSEPKLVFVLLNNTFMGLMTGLYLHRLNSVFRTYGAVFSILFTAVLSRLLLDVPIDGSTVLALGIVIAALVIYVRNPIVSDCSIDSNDDKNCVTIKKSVVNL